jgi:hypothetical protein
MATVSRWLLGTAGAVLLVAFEVYPPSIEYRAHVYTLVTLTALVGALLSPWVSRRLFEWHGRSPMPVLGAVFVLCGGICALVFAITAARVGGSQTAALTLAPSFAREIRNSVLQLVHELRLVQGKDFRAEALQTLLPGEQLAADSQAQTLFALTPNAGFTVVPSLRPVTDAMASLEAFITEPTKDYTVDSKGAAKVSGVRIVPGYEGVHEEYRGLLAMPWVLNARKYTNGAVVDTNDRFQIILFGIRPASQEMLDRLVKSVEQAESKFAQR